MNALSRGAALCYALVANPALASSSWLTELPALQGLPSYVAPPMEEPENQNTYQYAEPSISDNPPGYRSYMDNHHRSNNAVAFSMDDQIEQLRKRKAYNISNGSSYHDSTQRSQHVQKPTNIPMSRSPAPPKSAFSRPTTTTTSEVTTTSSEDYRKFDKSEGMAVGIIALLAFIGVPCSALPIVMNSTTASNGTFAQWDSPGDVWGSGIIFNIGFSLILATMIYLSFRYITRGILKGSFCSKFVSSIFAVGLTSMAALGGVQVTMSIADLKGELVDKLDEEGNVMLDNLGNVQQDRVLPEGEELATYLEELGEGYLETGEGVLIALVIPFIAFLFMLWRNRSAIWQAITCDPNE